MNRKFKIFKNECNIEYNEMDYDRAVAISIAGEIISTENFGLDIDKNGEFKLVDYQEANLGGIENDRFTNLANVIDRLSIYHQDTYYKPFKEIPTFIEQIKSEKINKNEDKTEDFDIDL